MLALGRFETNNTHVVHVDVPTAQLRVEIIDPRDGTPLAIEGAVVCLRGADGNALTARETTNRDGDVTLSIAGIAEGSAVEFDFRDREFFDLDEQTLVPATDVAPLDSRALLRMPELWRSDEQAELFDDLDGRAKDGTLPAAKQDGQGTDERPWVLRLDHAWTKIDIVFEFYDVVAAALSRVERGIMLDAFEGTSFAGSKRVGGGTAVNGDQVHHLRLFRAVSPEDLTLRAACPQGTYVDLNTGGIPLARLRTQAGGEGATLGERLQRYELPPSWLSRGQFASLDGGATAKPFEEVTNSLLGGGKTVTFDLDDVLLVDDEGKPIKIEDAIPVSVFGRDFVVKRPTLHEPQHSDVVIDRAHQRGRDLYYFDRTDEDGSEHPYTVTRVIRRGRKFYDLNGSRTTTGKVIGVRAAVREAHPTTRNPKATIAGCEDARGDFHYFKDVGVVDLPSGNTTPLDVILVVVTCRPRLFRLAADTRQDGLETLRQGLASAASRWSAEPLSVLFGDKPPHELQTLLHSRNGSFTAKFVFHFPSVEKGRGHINVFLVRKPGEDFRAHARRRAISLNLTDDFFDVEKEKGEKKSKAEPSTLAPSTVEDGTPRAMSTTAHELGHILGLPDEYSERISDKLNVPRADQGERTTHLNYHGGSMMAQSHDPLLRHYWALGHYIVGLGRVASSAAPIVLCDTRRIPAAGPGARVHRFALPNSQPSPFAVASTTTLKRGPAPDLPLHLFLIGDEIDAFAKAGGADAILHCSPLIYVRRRRHGGHSRPDRDATHAAIERIRKEIETELNGPLFQLAATPPTGEAPAGRILIRVLPRFTKTKPFAADLRFHVHDVETSQATVEGNKLTAHLDIPGSTICRALLGLSLTPPPSLTALGSGNGFLTIELHDGTKTKFKGSESRTPGAKNFVVQKPSPDVEGSFVPAAAETVASSLVEAINDPLNGLSKHITASVDGVRVSLDVSPDVAPIKVSAHGFDIEDGRGMTTSELTFLEPLATTLTGASYTLERGA